MTNDNDDKIIPLFGGRDPRAGELAEDILQVIYERGGELSTATVVGALEIIKLTLILNSLDE
jgi:hypothetical protein